MLRDWMQSKEYDPDLALIITIETTHYSMKNGELLAVCVADPATDKVEKFVLTGVDKEAIEKNKEYTGIDGRYYDSCPKIHEGALEHLLEEKVAEKQFIVGFSLDAPGSSGQFTRNWLQLYFPGLFRGKNTLDVTVAHKLMHESGGYLNTSPSDLTELMELANRSYPKHTGYTYKKVWDACLPVQHTEGRVFENKIENMLDLYKTILDRNYA